MQVTNEMNGEAISTLKANSRHPSSHTSPFPEGNIFNNEFWCRVFWMIFFFSFKFFLGEIFVR